MNTGRITFATTPEPQPFGSDLIRVLALADHIRDLEVDRHELQVALDDQIALVQSLQDEIKRLLNDKVK